MHFTGGLEILSLEQIHGMPAAGTQCSAEQNLEYVNQHPKRAFLQTYASFKLFFCTLIPRVQFASIVLCGA